MRIWDVENRLLVLLSVAEATLLLDRLSVGFLGPFLATDLHLSNLQLGMLSSLFSASFALSGYLVSAASDRSGRRWSWLIGLILLFSAVSALNGFSQTFGQLAAARVILGLFEGPFLPIALSLMADQSSPGRRSFNMAFVQNVGAFLLAQLAGPIILVFFAVHFSWRGAFFLTATPGLVVAALMPVLRRYAPDMRMSASSSARDTRGYPETGSIWQRNVLLCVAIAACMGSWILLQMTFLPKYLVQVAELDPTRMSLVMSLLGIGGCAASVLLPVLSDRFGRRAMLVLGTVVAIASPLGTLFAYQSTALLTVAILIGSIAFGCSPLYVAIVPSDSVAPEVRARALALVSASSAIMGGIVAPSVAGHLADKYGLAMPFWLAGSLSLVAAVLVSLLKPTAHRLLAGTPQSSVIVRDTAATNIR